MSELILYRTGVGWINWLFNPWFRVMSTFAGETKERKMVWDIVWGWSFILGESTAHPFIDGDQNLHLDFYVEEMAQTGEWKTYTIDLLDMAEQALDHLIPMPGGGSVPVRDIWQFEVDDLYLWSIDALVEGFDYDSQFSVDFLKVTYETPSPPGGGGGCPYVSTWDGSKFVLDNNLIPAAEYSNGTDVTDYYLLQQRLSLDNGKYRLLISERDKHSYLDHAQLLAVDHESDVNVAVSPDGEILTYRNPTPPETAITRDGQDVLFLVNTIDGNYYEGYQDDYLIVDFGSQDTTRGAKLVLRTDPCSRQFCKLSIYVQTLISTGSWNDVASIIPRAYWSTDIVDLSAHLPDINGELKVRLYFTGNHRIDYIGLDTTKQEEFEVRYANLAMATHSIQGDVKETLMNSDNQYAELLPDEQVTLQFTLPQNTQEKRDFIIILEGHYYTIQT